MTETLPPTTPTGAVLSFEGAAAVRRAIPESATIDQWPSGDGWPLRHLRWAPPDAAQDVRGSLLFLGGRGDHFEKYLESFEQWRGSGWQVESVDWRGQGGSGRVLDDPHIGSIDEFATWIDDIGAFAADWVARTPGPHVVIGHSMGGHLVVRALAERRLPVNAAVLVAPMMGFLAPYPDWLGLLIARAMCRIGDPDRAAWKASEKPGASQRLRQTLLTHDDGRYADEQWWHAANPALLLGPASWRWIRAAYRSFMALRQSGVLEGISTPCLFLIASADKLVSPVAARRDAARIPNARTHVYGREAAHELLREADSVRDDAMVRIDRFLSEVLS